MVQELKNASLKFDFIQLKTDVIVFVPRAHIGQLLNLLQLIERRRVSSFLDPNLVFVFVFILINIT